MPTYKVNTPEGQVIEVDADAGASDAQIISLAQQKALTAPAPRHQATFDQRLLSSVPGRMLKGIKDPIDAGAQLLPRALSTVASGFGAFPNSVSNWLDSEAKRVDTDISDAERTYQTARWATGKEGFDGARLAGNIASPVNLAIGSRLPQAMSTLGRVGTGALGGSIGGVLTQPVNEGGEGAPDFLHQKIGQALTGAFGGALLTPALGKVADVLAPRIKALAAKFSDPAALLSRAGDEAETAISQVMRDAGLDSSSIPPAMMSELRGKVVEALKQGQKLDAPAQLRKLDFEAQGVPALRGQITRDPRQYSSELNLRGIEGVGAPIQNLLAAQNQKITSDLAKFGGPNAMERTQAGSLFVDSLKKLDERLSGDVSRAYQNARSSSGKDWDVPMQRLAGDVANVLDTFGVGGERNAIPSAIANKLKSFGIVNDPAMTQRKVFNYEEADKLLKQINAHDDGGNASLGALRDAVKRALSEAGGEGDPFKVARQMASDRFKLLDAIPALEAASKGKIAPDDFVQRFIVGGKVGDLKKLAEVLPQEGLDEARKQIARVVYEGAFKGNAAGDKLASPNGLQTALKAIGTEKLKLFFNPAEIEELQRISRVTAYANTEPAWGTVARGGNPGGALFGALAKTPGSGLAGRVLPLVGTIQQANQARSALNAAVPKGTNLTPEEIRLMSGLLGTATVTAGGLLSQ